LVLAEARSTARYDRATSEEASGKPGREGGTGGREEAEGGMEGEERAYCYCCVTV